MKGWRRWLVKYYYSAFMTSSSHKIKLFAEIAAHEEFIEQPQIYCIEIYDKLTGKVVKTLGEHRRPDAGRNVRECAEREGADAN